MPTGRVKWYNDQKGFGFIESDNGQDLFCHHSGIAMSGFRTLAELTRVEFDITQGPKGPQATNIRYEREASSAPVIPMGPKIVAAQTFVLPPSMPAPGGLKGLFKRSPFGSGSGNKSKGKATTISAAAAKSILPG